MLNTANPWPPELAAILRKDQADLDTEMSTGRDSDEEIRSAEERRKDKEVMRLERNFLTESMNIKCAYPDLTYDDKLVLHHGGREFRFISMTADARGATILYLPKEKILVTGDLLSYPIPYFTPPLSERAKNLRIQAQFDADVIIPGCGPAWHDKDFVSLETELFETIVSQVGQAVQQGMLMVEEVQNAAKVEPSV